ncbi:MAG: hypothetical protein ACE5O2_08050 [Armatimonadota bacterium]
MTTEDETETGARPEEHVAAESAQAQGPNPESRRSEAAGLIIASVAAAVIVVGAVLYVRKPPAPRPETPVQRTSAERRSVKRLPVHVEAFYPDTEGHRNIKELVLSLPEAYPGMVSAEFIDFRSGDGFDRWRAAGLTCGAVVINGKWSVVLEDENGEREVAFTQAMGGEWTADDLKAAVAQAVAKASATTSRTP